MENSVLSDASGVSKNIAQMYEEYAASIGKSSDALTQAEKVQAVYNGFMSEAGDFAGTAAETAKEYQGQQAQLNATNLELSRTLGESMIPALTQYNSILLSIMKGLTEFVSNHKSATSGIITFTTTLLAMVVGLTTAKKAYTAYKAAADAANMTTKAFTVSLLTNPITLIAVAFAAVTAGISIFNTKLQESIDKMEEASEKEKTLAEALNNWGKNDMTYTEEEESIVKKERDEAEEIVKIYDEKANKIAEIEQKIKENKESDEANFIKNNRDFELKDEWADALVELEDYKKQLEENGKTIDDYRTRVNTLTKTLDLNDAKQKYLTATNQKAHRETLINIAQTKADINGKQKLLDILKQGKTNTEQYTDAKKSTCKSISRIGKSK